MPKGIDAQALGLQALPQIRESAFSIGIVRNLVLAGLELSTRLRAQQPAALVGTQSAESADGGSPVPAPTADQGATRWVPAAGGWS